MLQFRIASELVSKMQVAIFPHRLAYTIFCCSLLLRRECCSFSNGEYVKAGLAELEHWCYKATDEVPSICCLVTLIL